MMMVSLQGTGMPLALRRLMVCFMVPSFGNAQRQHSKNWPSTRWDVVQEVFIKVWSHKKELVDDPKAQYYLFTAVRNNCISLLRKKIHHLSVEDDGVLNKLEMENQDSEKHEFKASDISGVMSGPLMCDTIAENPKPRNRSRRSAPQAEA